MRTPTNDDLAALIHVAEQGVHAPGEIVFGDMWTNKDPDDIERHLLQWHWRCWANFTPDKWTFPVVVRYDGDVIGAAWIFAEHFRILRSFGSSSWLGLGHQGKGFGKELRAGVLAFGFSVLGAREARTNALADNAASIGVSKSLGYDDNGQAERLVGGSAVTGRMFRMSREKWERDVRQRYEVTISGAAGAVKMFGADDDESAPVPKKLRCSCLERVAGPFE